MQELKRHLRLCLPRWWADPSALTLVQKFHHLNHGLQQALTGVRPLLVPLGLAIAASMPLHGERIAVLGALWLTASITLVAGGLLWWLTGRVALHCTLRDALAANLASKALAHAIAVGSL